MESKNDFTSIVGPYEFIFMEIIHFDCQQWKLLPNAQPEFFKDISCVHDAGQRSEEHVEHYQGQYPCSSTDAHVEGQCALVIDEVKFFPWLYDRMIFLKYYL